MKGRTTLTEATDVLLAWSGGKDSALAPLNTDFDLYSVGPDGDSRLPLTAAASRDDILRANNGAFIGRAENYN